MNSENCPPHEMSYLTTVKLQYGGTRTQESVLGRPHFPGSEWTDIHTYPQERGRAWPRRLSRQGAVSMLTGRRAIIEWSFSAARKGGTFHFGRLPRRTHNRHRHERAHERGSEIAFVADLSARRSRVRARGGRVALGNRWRALSRLHSGRGGQCAR